MKRWLLLIALFTVGMLFAWEPFMALTLQTNVADQVKFVMPNRHLHFSAVSKVEQDQLFQMEIAFITRNKAVNGKKFTGFVTVFTPDGKRRVVLSERPVGSIPVGGQGVFTSDLKCRIGFDHEEKPGVYRFELTLKDDAGNVKTITREIELVKSIVDNSPMDEKSFNEFIHFYYRDPKPGKFFAAWDFYLKTAVVKQQKKEGSNFNPSAGLLGFCEILKLNPQFHDEFAAMCGKAEVENHLYYAYICAGLGGDFMKKYEKVIHPDIKILVKRLGGQDPFVIDEVTAPYHLDMLWVKFTVTGSFEPVRLLCRELRQRPFMEIEEAKAKRASGKGLTPEEQQRLMNRIMQIAAWWSLESNIKQGDLLAEFYLETIVSRKLYTDELEAQLIVTILKNINSKRGNKK